MEDLMNGMETTMDEIQYIVVKLGNEKYGIDISCVDNIVRMQHMTKMCIRDSDRDRRGSFGRRGIRRGNQETGKCQFTVAGGCH